MKNIEIVGDFSKELHIIKLCGKNDKQYWLKTLITKTILDNISIFSIIIIFLKTSSFLFQFLNPHKPCTRISVAFRGVQMWCLL